MRGAPPEVRADMSVPYRRFPAALLACAAFAMQANCAPVRTVTLCDLASLATKMTGQTVRIHGIYITDLKHVTILKDRRCPGVSFTVVDGSSRDVDPTVEQFDRAVYGELSDLDLRVFEVDLIGIARWDENDSNHETLAIHQVKSFRRLHGGDWKTAQ
jgi:hypothetical protein